MQDELIINRGFGGGAGPGRGMGRGSRWIGDYSLMDVRLVEPALLAFLLEEDLHGYGLLEKLGQLGLESINPSVVYRILRDYEDLGLVTSDWDSTGTQGPPRRVYSITEEGKAALVRAEGSLSGTMERIQSILNLLENHK